MPVTKSGNSRLWIIPHGADPDHEPIYMKGGMADTPSYNPGAVTSIYGPDPKRYNNYVVIDEVQAGEERPTIDIRGRYDLDRLSKLLEIAKSKCPVDVLIPFGDCRDPSRLNSGWDKLLVFSGGKLTSWTTDRGLGSFEPTDNAPVNEQSTVSAKLFGEVDRMRFTETAQDDVSGNILGIVVCDSATCGDCGQDSDGCRRVFAISSSSTASPAASNDLLYSTDGGATWGERPMTFTGPTAEPNGIACVGDYLVILNEPQALVAYILIDDLLAGTGEFGIINMTGENPRAVYSQAPDLTWIAGDGGVWLMRNPVGGVTQVLDGGVATGISLRSVHAYDDWNIVAVGTLNGVVVSTDQGETWRAVTGPAGGVTLTKVWMRSPTRWFVGTQTNVLYFTADAGASWTRIRFPFDGNNGVFRDIVFAPDLPNVGYLSTSDSSPKGRMMRTIDGGFSWYTMPESGVAGAFPVIDYIGSIAVCHANRIYVGGLHSNGSDGVILIGSPA